jgi:hypothetical protein
VQDPPDLTIAPTAGAYRTVQDAPIDPALVAAWQDEILDVRKRLSVLALEDEKYAQLAQRAEHLAQDLARAQSVVDGTVYRIASVHRPLLVKRVATHSKRGVRAGSGPVTLRLLGHAHFAPMIGPRPTRHRARLVEYEWVALRGPAPQANGFEILARLEPLPDGSQIIRRMPNLSAGASVLDIERWRGQAQWCDHCQTLRRRNHTYLVWNQQSGEIRQVGKSCLRDYTGTDLPEAVLKHAEQYYALVHAISTYSGEWQIERRDTHVAYRTSHFMIACAMLVREEGRYWTKSSLALYEQDRATAPRAWQRLIAMHDPQTRADLSARERDALKIQPEDRALAGRVLRFADELEEDSEYVANLRAWARQEFVTRRGAATLGSAFALYADSLREKPERQALDEHFGEVGKRYALELKVKRVIELYDPMGRPFWMCVFEDGSGRSFRCTRSRPDLEAGALYSLHATMKAHDESDRFGKVTVLANPRAIREMLATEDSETPRQGR